MWVGIVVVLKLRNYLLMLTCVVSVKIHLYQFYLDAIRL